MSGKAMLRILVALCGALLVLALGGTTPSYAQENANVVIKFLDDAFNEFDDPPSPLAVGDTFKIVVRIETGTKAINAATISLKFDDDVLAIVPFKSSPFAEEVGGQVVGSFSTVRNLWGNTAGDGTDGYAEVTVFDEPDTGILYVIIYEFEAIGQGTTTISHYSEGDRSPVGGKTEIIAASDISDVTGTTAPTPEIRTGILAVNLGWFLAEQNDNEIVFRWQTVTETGTAGFHVLAVVDGRALQLNRELIASTVVDSVTPMNYSFAAETSATQFKLQEVGVNGGVTEHGCFDLGVEYGVYALPANVDLTPQAWLPLISR